MKFPFFTPNSHDFGWFFGAPSGPSFEALLARSKAAAVNARNLRGETALLLAVQRCDGGGRVKAMRWLGGQGQKPGTLGWYLKIAGEWMVFSPKKVVIWKKNGFDPSPLGEVRWEMAMMDSENGSNHINNMDSENGSRMESENGD